MAEAVAETGSYSQDLFSPLQFCEVVEEGNQQRIQQHHLHHVHMTHQQPAQPPTDQVKQEIPQQTKQQEPQSQPVAEVNCSRQALINPIGSMEILLTTNPVQLQSTNSTIAGFHQQPLYQVQLTRQMPLQHLHINSLQLHPHDSSVQQQSLPLRQREQQLISQLPHIGNVPAITDTVSVALPLAESLKEKTVVMNAVGTQTMPLDNLQKENDDEPEIVYASSNLLMPSILQPTTNNASLPCIIGKIEEANKNEVKPPPVKRTWRRPWKKKKEREKRQPVKRARRVKRRRIVFPKKHVIHIDSRNGPAIDTSHTVVQRQSEDTINQLKQKRQRIKLNRNSGREYINRLGKPASESRRQNTFEYFVRISGKHLRVCKKAFMSSHGLTSDKRLRTLFHQMKDGALIPELDRRGKHLRPSKSPVLGNCQPNHVNNEASLSHSKSHNKKVKTIRKRSQVMRMENKPTVYAAHPVTHLHQHCTPPPPHPPSAHAAVMQEPPHAYIPNGEIYFPGHYLEPPQTMHHMNQIPNCQKMLEAPAYFMAGMKENTFHQ